MGVSTVEEFLEQKYSNRTTVDPERYLKSYVRRPFLPSLASLTAETLWAAICF